MAPVFMKWAGGKAQSLALIDPHIPTEISNYYEPFLGGGSVLLHVLASLKAGTRRLAPGGESKIVAADINPVLVYVYQLIQDLPQVLIHELNSLLTQAQQAPCAEDNYYEIRDLYNVTKAAGEYSAHLAAMFLYLNQNGFRGLYRENKAGEFNVPFGHYKKPINPNLAHILEAHLLFNEFPVEFHCKNAGEFMDEMAIDERTAVFLDPPYEKLSATTFIAYYAGGAAYSFGALCDWLQREGRNCHAILTNHATPELVERFKDFPVCQTFSARRAIHAQHPDSRADELIVCSQAPAAPQGV
jgi:DNA adenine methylase